MLGVVGLVLDLHPQPPDVGVDEAAVAEVVVAPDPFEELVAREHHAGVVGELAQQQELRLGERHLLAPLQHHTLLPAQLEIAEVGRPGWRHLLHCTRRRRARMRAASSLVTTGLVT